MNSNGPGGLLVVFRSIFSVTNLNNMNLLIIIIIVYLVCHAKNSIKMSNIQVPLKIFQDPPTNPYKAAVPFWVGASRGGPRGIRVVGISREGAEGVLPLNLANQVNSHEILERVKSPPFLWGAGGGFLTLYLLTHALFSFFFL